MTDVEELERRLKAMTDEDGDDRYITDDDDLWSIAHDLLTALKRAQATSEHYVKGMANWKATAQAKDKDIIHLRKAIEEIANKYTMKELNYHGRVLALTARKALEKQGET